MPSKPPRQIMSFLVGGTPQWHRLSLIVEEMTASRPTPRPLGVRVGTNSVDIASTLGDSGPSSANNGPDSANLGPNEFEVRLKIPRLSSLPCLDQIWPKSATAFASNPPAMREFDSSAQCLPALAPNRPATHADFGPMLAKLGGDCSTPCTRYVGTRDDDFWGASIDQPSAHHFGRLAVDGHPSPRPARQARSKWTRAGTA